MDAQVFRWITMIAAVGGLIGGIYGFFTYKEEEEKPLAKVLPLPNCDACAEYA